MTPENALLQLRDIHLPLAESRVDTLPDWLLPACAALTVLAIWLWRKRRRAMNWQRQAQAELDAITRAAQQGHVLHGWQRLSIVLRQLALLHSHQINPASSTGEQWLRLLDQLFATNAFTGPDGQALLRSPYQLPTKTSGEPSDLALLRLTELVRRQLPTLGIPGPL